VLFLAAFLMAASFAPSYAADADDEFAAEKHPIDVEFEKKLEEDDTTAGMINACVWAEVEWDKLLNENYQALTKGLKGDDLAKLKASQSAWIKFRDAEFAFSGQFYGGFGGTMYQVSSAMTRTDFVKARALQLGSYFFDLEDR
jgi:uncharacterized protein YecT (DUF1311 family)